MSDVAVVYFAMLLVQGMLMGFFAVAVYCYYREKLRFMGATREQGELRESIERVLAGLQVEVVNGQLNVADSVLTDAPGWLTDAVVRLSGSREKNLPQFNDPLIVHGEEYM